MPDLTKTSLCRKWIEGKCPLTAADCGFAHGKRELKMTAEFAKRSADKAMAKGRGAKVSAPSSPENNRRLMSSPDACGLSPVQTFQDHLGASDTPFQMFQDRLDLATMLGLGASMQQGDTSSTSSTTLNADDVTSSRSGSEDDMLLAKLTQTLPLRSEAIAMPEWDPVKTQLVPPPGLDACSPMKVTLSRESYFGGYQSSPVASPFGLGGLESPFNFRTQTDDHFFEIDPFSTVTLTL
jgi:hypothetical protein